MHPKVTLVWASNLGSRRCALSGVDIEEFRVGRVRRVRARGDHTSLSAVASTAHSRLGCELSMTAKPFLTIISVFVVMSVWILVNIGRLGEDGVAQLGGQRSFSRET